METQLSIELQQLSENNNVIEYFKTRSIKQFVLNYIEIDKIICGGHSIDPLADVKCIANTLTTMSDMILDKASLTTDKISELRNDINFKFEINKVQINAIESRIQAITDVDLRKALTDFYSTANLNNKHEFELFNERIQNITQNNAQQIINSIQNRDSDTFSQLNDKLTGLLDTFKNNSSKKGEYAENILTNLLVTGFPDSEVLCTSAQPHSGDIQIKKNDRPDILIDSKNFQTNVPKVDLEKFFDDCKLNDASGILCSAFSGICNKKHLEIDIIDSRVYVYLSNHSFDPELFKLAVRIIYNIHSIIKDKKTDDITLNKELFERIKVEFVYFNQTLQTHLDSIKANVNSISQLSMTQLDQFFKRSNFSTDLKPFSCPHCSTGCSSTKALNKHLLTKHDIKLTKTRLKKEPEIEEPVLIQFD